MERSGREWNLVQRAGTGQYLVAFCGGRRGMGSLRERLLDVDAAFRLYLGIGLFLGIFAVPMRQLELLRQLRLGLDAGYRGLLPLVGRRRLLCPQRRNWLWRLSPADATAYASSSPHWKGRPQ